MSPVGGVGINYAVQDAVVAANVLTKPLLDGHVPTDQLRTIQRKREWAIRIIQAFQTQIRKRVIATALRAQEQTIKTPSDSSNCSHSRKPPRNLYGDELSTLTEVDRSVCDRP
jgi:2-polyprenyl-6-methoxyphenol hydroxylase-like FAD-dependent oxidoreductase